jgi:hypothetical protein
LIRFAVSCLDLVNNFYRESSYQQNLDSLVMCSVVHTSDQFDVRYLSDRDLRKADRHARLGLILQAITGSFMRIQAYRAAGLVLARSAAILHNAGSTGAMILRTVAHELGHNFGLYHARALDCGSQVIGSSCTTIEYGDSLDILGQNRHHRAFARESEGTPRLAQLWHVSCHNDCASKRHLLA